MKAAITFAKSYVDIEDSDIYTILHLRKSLLCSTDDVWIKHSGSLFDVTMGSYDGAEICELVGLFLLSKLSNVIHMNNIGLYRDDGLAIIRKSFGPEMERTRKKVIAIFKTHGLKVTVDTNSFQKDFLDATFDLNSGKFWPYRKPNDSPLYINTRSNHPPSITKQLPHMISNRIAQLSCDRGSFDNAIPPYAEALRKAGHSPCTAYPMHSTTAPNCKKQQEKETSSGSIPHIPVAQKSKQILAKSSSISSTSTSPQTTASTRFATNLASNSATAACRTWHAASKATTTS